MKRLHLFAISLTLAMIAGAAQAQTTRHKTPPKKQPAVGTLGTEQAKGGDGLFGTTYTIANSGGYVYNVVIASAEYSVARHNVSEPTSLAPKADEKLLILHLRVQNPKPDDAYISGSFVSFSTVAQDNQTRNHNDYIRLASAKDHLSNTLKPGQKFPEEVLAACIVPAKGPIPKLILNMGRQGTNEDVIRFYLGQAPNIVKPLPAPFADPADPTGATALAEVPAQVGTTYPAGYFDFRLDSLAFAPGPIAGEEAGDGKRFLVATLTVNNKTFGATSFNGTVAATLFTSDDEKTEDFITLKGKRDERWEGRKLDPDESVTVRLLFSVPNNVTGKTLKLAEYLDNSGSKSHALVYDLSSVK